MGMPCAVPFEDGSGGCEGGRRIYGPFASAIDLFSLYVLFSHFRPRDATPENSSFQVSSYARANVRIFCEKTKGKFP